MPFRPLYSWDGIDVWVGSSAGLDFSGEKQSIISLSPNLAMFIGAYCENRRK